MPEEVFGSGIKINEQPYGNDEFAWDLVVDNTGDLDSESGLNELEKDIAFNVGRFLERRVGQQLTQTTIERTALTVRRIMINDPRIESIDRFGTRQPEQNTLEVGAVITASDEQQYDFVFPVG